MVDVDQIGGAIAERIEVPGEVRDLLLLDVGAWFTAAQRRGFFCRYREDLIGFFLAWAAVGLLILSAWLLMQIGK